MSNKIVYLISGGIAAGKSTLSYNVMRKLHLEQLPFVSTDIYYKEFFSQNVSFDVGYARARTYTDKIIDYYIRIEQSFVWETVVSKEKKISTIHKLKECGYKLIYFFVGTSSAKIATQRSDKRVEEGNHFVGEDFIIDRYERSLKTFPVVLQYADVAAVFDNTDELTLIYYKGETTFRTNCPPQWFKDRIHAED